jgi:hypothetical protein
MDEERTFLRLSQVLTGKSELDPVLSRAYLDRLKRQPTAAAVADLLARFAEIQAAHGDVVAAVRDRIFGDSALAGVAKTTLLLWYTGGIHIPGASGKWEMESAEQFFGALVWEVIGAHAPGASTGFFGHWRYEPECGGR